MNYRVINYQDLYKDAVLAAINQGYQDIGYSGIELESLDADLNKINESYQAPSIFKLVFNGDELIATFAVKIQNDNAELKRVYVKKGYRNQGLAKKISIEAFEYVQSLGLKEINIWSGTLCNTAHKLYEKLGAIKTSNQRDLGGIDSVIEYHYVKHFA